MHTKLKIYLICALFLSIYGCKNTKATSLNSDTGNYSEVVTSLDSLFNAGVAQNQMAGVVCLITEKEKTIYSKALGYRNIEEGLVMEKNSMFRLQSMAKPIISLAILKLCSEGKLALDDPASKYFPQLRDKQVGIMKDGVIEYVPASRPITIRHLLSHSSGLGSSWNAGELASFYEQHETFTNFSSYEHWIESYMELPLIDHPGKGWYYGHGHAIMEYLITKVSGMSHVEYLEKEIFKPLKMDNTTYQLPEGEEKTLAQYYSLTESGQFKRTLSDSTYTGGGDLMTNVEDYYKFCQLLLNNGYLDGKEFIKPAMIKELSTPVVGIEEGITVQKGYGFGLGVSKRLSEGKTEWMGSVGDYGWFGFYNTAFWIDPKKEIIGIVLTQSPYNDYLLSKEVRKIVYSKKQDLASNE